jgi:hypothetical protein
MDDAKAGRIRTIAVWSLDLPRRIANGLTLRFADIVSVFWSIP